MSAHRKAIECIRCAGQGAGTMEIVTAAISPAAILMLATELQAKRMVMQNLVPRSRSDLPNM